MQERLLCDTIGKKEVKRLQEERNMRRDKDYMYARTVY